MNATRRVRRHLAAAAASLAVVAGVNLALLPNGPSGHGLPIGAPVERWSAPRPDALIGPPAPLTGASAQVDEGPELPEVREGEAAGASEPLVVRRAR
ncbi:MAG TPA: hypothetical protein PKE32_07985 [Miltoncostaeaceae bacterium]|nr:hypothetical protein [Miltoncostaeaceae bacterium]